MTLVGYSPFGSGDFPSPKTAGGRLLAEIGKRHGAGAHAVARAFLLRDPHVLSIPKASTSAHVDANRAAADLELTAAEIKQIDGHGPAGPDGVQVL